MARIYVSSRSYLTRRGIKVRIARRGIESSDRLGRHRWKAERTIAWLARCRRLSIRSDRDAERFFAFAMLPAAGCATTGCRCPMRPPPGYHDPGLGWRARRGRSVTSS
jgi:hypothetical protein